MAATQGFLKLETKNDNQQQKCRETVTKRKRTSRKVFLVKRNASVKKLGSKGSSPVDFPRVTSTQVKDVKPKKPIIKNLIFHWNSKRCDNPISLLHNNAQRSKKSIQFQDLGRTAGGLFSCAVSIDDILIATGTDQTKKKAKWKCADTAVKLLLTSQHVIDQAKSSNTKQPTSSVSKKELPVLQSREHERSETPKIDVLNHILKNMQWIETGSVSTSCLDLRKKNRVETKSSKSTKSNSVKECIKRNSQKQLQISNNSVQGQDPVERLCKQGEQQANKLGPKIIKEYPKIPESNVGCQMLRKMGWNGGGLGREGNKGRVEPIMASVVRGRQGLGIEVSPGLKKKKQPGMSSKKCEHIAMIEEFMKTASKKELQFSTSLTAEEFAAIQSFCKQHGLQWNFMGQSKGKCLVITKPEDISTTGKSVNVYIPTEPIKSKIEIEMSSAPAKRKFVTDVDIQAVPIATTAAIDVNIPAAPMSTMAAVDVDTPTATMKPKVILDLNTPTASNSTMATMEVDTPTAAMKSKVIIDVNTAAPKSTMAIMNVDTPTAATKPKIIADINLPAPPRITTGVIDVDIPTAPTPTNVAAIVDANMPTPAKTTKLIIDLDNPNLPLTSKSVIDVDKLPDDTCKSIIDVKKQTITRTSNSVIAVESIKTFRSFLKSSEKVLRVSSRLSRKDRVRLFELCDRFGLQFHLFSKGDERRIVINKTIH